MSAKTITSMLLLFSGVAITVAIVKPALIYDGFLRPNRFVNGDVNPDLFVADIVGVFGTLIFLAITLPFLMKYLVKNQKT